MKSITIVEIDRIVNAKKSYTQKVHLVFDVGGDVLSPYAFEAEIKSLNMAEITTGSWDKTYKRIKQILIDETLGSDNEHRLTHLIEPMIIIEENRKLIKKEFEKHIKRDGGYTSVQLFFEDSRWPRSFYY